MSRVIVKTIPEIKNIERFLSRIVVDKKANCWLWRGHIDLYGYGVVSLRGSKYKAHRISYSIFKGDLNPDLVIDHICSVRACLNPTHLREVDKKTNILENSVGEASKNKAKTHCPRGHLLLNSVYISNGKRECKICKLSKPRTIRKIKEVVSV